MRLVPLLVPLLVFRVSVLSLVISLMIASSVINPQQFHLVHPDMKHYAAAAARFTYLLRKKWLIPKPSVLFMLVGYRE